MAVLRRLRGGRVALVAALVALAVVVAGFAVVLGSMGRGSGEVSAVAPAMPEPAPHATGKDAATAGGSGAGSPSQARSALPESAADTAAAPAQGVPVGGVQRALVRSAQLTVEVGDPVGAMRQVRTAAAAVGGFVTDERTGDAGSWLTLRVPADALDRLMEDVAAAGRVTARTTQVYDATEESIDLDARVATQQASVARVRSLLARAESIGDVVAIESELSRREAELDSLTRRLEALRDQVAMSTLTVDLRAPGAPPPSGPAPGFGDGLAAGWAGLQVLGSGMAAVVGFVLPFLPVVAVLAGIGWLVRRIVRARRAPAPAPGGGTADGEN